MRNGTTERAIHVAAIEFQLHLPVARSLKAKRAVVKPIVEGLRARFRVAAAEVDHLDVWQRAAIGAAVVAGSAAHADDVLDEVERFVWSRPDIEVLDVRRRWLEED